MARVGRQGLKARFYGGSRSPPQHEGKLNMELKPRTPEYWESIHENLCTQVENLSRDLETRNRWDGPSPWIAFKFDWDPANLRAYIERKGLQATIGYGLGLVVRFDELAKRIQSNEQLRSRLNIAERWENEDLSQWMVLRWFDWIFHHEVAHFLCGHLSAGLPKWTEGDRAKGKDTDFTQALEFDADAFAAFSFFTFLEHCLKKNIHQDFYGTNDVGAIFWDFGILFAGLFVEFEKMNPHDKVRTHPTAPQRFVCLIVEGGAAYQAALGRSASAEWTSFTQGITVGLVFSGEDGKRLADLLSSTQLDVAKWKKALLKAGILKKRLLRAPNDWLRR